MRIRPLGDSALLVRVCECLADSPRETLSAVLGTTARLEAARLPGVLELAPAYTTIALYYEPLAVIAAGAPADGVFDWLREKIQAVVSTAGGGNEITLGTRTIEIPVAYGGDFGPDFDALTQHTGLSASEAIALHTGTDYWVHCLGFTPGFPYLSGLPPSLAMPRRQVPRKEVPAGSVAIGGAQTGIYPVSSPAGWNIIGRTPLRLFGVDMQPPTLFQAGDRVRFRAITAGEFREWNEP